VSSIEWLPRGLEQFAPPISQLLPVTRELTYRVGGNRFIDDASAANFDPHWWLFELGTAKWRKGYDTSQLPVYEITLVQLQVFHVLLVDYWQPPNELARYNQPVAYGRVLAVAQDAAPSVVVGSVDADGASAGGSVDSGGYVSTGGPG